MKVKIHNIKLDLHYSMRMMIIYENITGENFDFTNIWIIDSNNYNGGYPYLRDCPFQFKKLSK